MCVTYSGCLLDLHVYARHISLIRVAARHELAHYWYWRLTNGNIVFEEG